MKAGSRAPRVRSTRRTGARTSHRVLTFLVGLVGIAFLAPIGYLLSGTLSLGEETWATFTSVRIMRPLANSVAIATSVALSCMVLGTILAWLVARTDLPGRRLWRIVLPLPLVIPSFVGATALLSAFGPGGLLPFVPRTEGFLGAFVVLTLLSYPFVYLPVLARLHTTDPSLEEAARLLGSKPVRIVARVVLPRIRNTVAAGTMLVFLYGLSDFGAVSLMRYDTITRAIFSARLFDRSTSFTLGLVLAMLALSVVALERRLGHDQRPDRSGGKEQVRYRLGAAAAPALTLILGITGAGLLAPLGVFVFWVLRGSSTVGSGYAGVGEGLGFLVRPVLSSGMAAVAAAIAAAGVTLPVAYKAARHRSRVSDLAAAGVTSLFGLPGLVVALAIVFWAIRAPGPLAAVYQSFPLLVAAYVLNFGAQSMRASRVAIADVSKRYGDAARTLGVGAYRRFFSVDFPLVAPGVMTGAGLVLLSTLKELPATLLLAPIGFETLATRIWNAAEDGFFAEVGITSLVLILLSGALTWGLVLRREPEEVGDRSAGGRCGIRVFPIHPGVGFIALRWGRRRDRGEVPDDQEQDTDAQERHHPLQRSGVAQVEEEQLDDHHPHERGAAHPYDSADQPHTDHHSGEPRQTPHDRQGSLEGG